MPETTTRNWYLELYCTFIWKMESDGERGGRLIGLLRHPCDAQTPRSAEEDSVLGRFEVDVVGTEEERYQCS